MPGHQLALLATLTAIFLAFLVIHSPKVWRSLLQGRRQGCTDRGHLAAMILTDYARLFHFPALPSDLADHANDDYIVEVRWRGLSADQLSLWSVENRGRVFDRNCTPVDIRHLRQQDGQDAVGQSRQLPDAYLFPLNDAVRIAIDLVAPYVRNQWFDQHQALGEAHPTIVNKT